MIYIVDDDLPVADALRMLVAMEGYEARSFGSPGALLASLDKNAKGCIVSDIRMPGMSGLELLTELRNRKFSLPVILITAYADVPLAVEAMKRGAADLLEKPFDDKTLIAAIRRALEKSSNESVGEQQRAATLKKYATLTKRELDVLSGLLKGLPNKTIAHDLGISARTVEVHRATLMSKMGAKSLPELVQLALLASPGDFPALTR